MIGQLIEVMVLKIRFAHDFELAEGEFLLATYILGWLKGLNFDTVMIKKQSFTNMALVFFIFEERNWNAFLFQKRNEELGNK